MGFGGFDFILVLFMFFSGGAGSGGGDFLDMIPTANYWQVQGVSPTVAQLETDAGPDAPVANIDKYVANLGSDDFKTRNDAKKKLEAMGPAIVPMLKSALESKDAEVSAVAHELVTRFAERGKARAVRRLMAIRTLGEKKEKSALPMLKELAGSKELFVADYANRAAAMIEGRVYVAPDHTAAVAGDLQLLPKDTGIAGQTTGLGIPVMPLDKMIDRTLDQMQGNPMMGGGQKLPDRDKVLRNVTMQVLKVVERVGNIRLDGATVGISENIGPNAGAGVISIRGLYDREAFISMVKAEAQQTGAAANEFKLSRDGDVDVMEVEDMGTVCLPSDNQMIVIMSSQAADRPAVVKGTLAALKTGNGGLAGNADMMALINSVDRKGPAWMAMKVNAVMKMEKVFEPFDTVTLTSARGKERTSFCFQATGKDPEKVKESVDLMNEEIKSTLNQIRPQLAQMKSMQPVVDMMESIKATAVATGATMTGEMKDSIMDSILVEAGGYFLMTMQDDTGNGTQP